jgi:hypothetical protein
MKRRGYYKMQGIALTSIQVVYTIRNHNHCGKSNGGTLEVTPPGPRRSGIGSFKSSGWLCPPFYPIFGAQNDIAFQALLTFYVCSTVYSVVRDGSKVDPNFYESAAVGCVPQAERSRSWQPRSGLLSTPAVLVIRINLSILSSCFLKRDSR